VIDPRYNVQMQERVAPSRPSRLGTRRRKPRPAVSALPEAGASRSGRKPGAPSLDTGNHLATTVRDWMESQLTEEDHRARQIAIHRRLNSTVHEIWQGYARDGNQTEALKWEKQWLKLHNCQSEWVGYRADCCKGYTQPVAVPIGCNHRMCPLCAWHRSQKARQRIKCMYDRLTHPVLITLTIPNKQSIRKHDFTLFRQKVKKWVAQRNYWIRGGVYSLETTYNRRERTWHIHAHILADVASPLPDKTVKVKLAGETRHAFTALKLRAEFDWLRLWGCAWGKAVRKDARQSVKDGETWTFEEWVRLGREHALKRGRYPIEGLSAMEIQRRTKWNAENRRIIDLRPVVDRDGAAREVLKYITKAADFCDIPEAVEPFVNATRGARLIQTFGSWYGVKLDEPSDAEHPEDWGEMKCTCGLNVWHRMGVFYRRDVVMQEDGRWLLRAPIDHNSRGTVPRPTIRALAERQGE